MHDTRWAPTSDKWSYKPYKWPYKWVTGVITLLIGVITPFITSRGPTLYMFCTIPLVQASPNGLLPVLSRQHETFGLVRRKVNWSRLGDPTWSIYLHGWLFFMEHTLPKSNILLMEEILHQLTGFVPISYKYIPGGTGFLPSTVAPETLGLEDEFPFGKPPDRCYVGFLKCRPHIECMCIGCCTNLQSVTHLGLKLTYV